MLWNERIQSNILIIFIFNLISNSCFIWNVMLSFKTHCWLGKVTFVLSNRQCNFIEIFEISKVVEFSNHLEISIQKSRSYCIWHSMLCLSFLYFIKTSNVPIILLFISLDFRIEFLDTFFLVVAQFHSVRGFRIYPICQTNT